MESKRIHPESIGSHRVSDGNMTSRALVKTTPCKNPERCCQTLLFLQLSLLRCRFSGAARDANRISVVEHR